MLLKQGTRPSTLLRWAIVCLIAFFAIPLITRVMPLGSDDLVDGVRGMLLGMTIGLMVWTGVLKRRSVS